MLMGNTAKKTLMAGVIILTVNVITGYSQDKEKTCINAADRLRNALNNEFQYFQDKGVEPVISRYGAVDIAYPANESEYCVLGGYAVVMIVAISEYSEELPIAKAYFQTRNKKEISLDKLGVSVDGGDLLGDKITKNKDDTGMIYFENISFWAIPVVCFIDDGGFIAVDFKGERKAFVILKGPWKLESEIRDWIAKHHENKIMVAEHVEYGQIAQFIEREFVKKNLVQL